MYSVCYHHPRASDLIRPSADKKHADDANFRKFRRQLFHTSLSNILSPLRQWMEDPEIVRCGDGHFRKVIYGIGPYIADYPEQALLACTVQGWCPVYVPISWLVVHEVLTI